MYHAPELEVGGSGLGSVVCRLRLLYCCTTKNLRRLKPFCKPDLADSLDIGLPRLRIGRHGAKPCRRVHLQQ